MFGTQHHQAELGRRPDDLGRRTAGEPARRSARQPRRAEPAGDASACVRCHSTERLVSGDGPVVCWPCAFAWGSFAALVTSGPTSIEPGMLSTCRTGHHQPRPGCVWCRGRLGEQSAFGLPGPNGKRGPAA